jgi:predicted PhzF superfamily epimerase YddE/YHI9
MELEIHQLDAFASGAFSGNPAAVVLSPEPLDELLMRAIARETALPATAFVHPIDGAFGVRWFTPEIEIELCGHATLASASVLFARGDATGEEAVFHSPAGTLRVVRDRDRYALVFPARPGTANEAPPALLAGLGATPLEVYRARDVMAVFARADEVAAIRADAAQLALVEAFGVIATAPGDDGDCDFVSRFFAPRAGLPEDSATGSSHCTLVPYWSRRLGKRELHARQLSPRGGEMFCRDDGERVVIGGRVVEFLRGRIAV